MNEETPHSPVTLRRRRLRRLLVGCVVLIALAAALFAWLFTSESGLRTLLGTAEVFSGGVLRAEGIDGTLRGPFSVARLTVDLPEVKVELSGLTCDWQPSGLFARKFVVTRLRIEQADVFLQESQTPPSSEPLTLPESLRLPLDVELVALEIDRLKLVGHTSDAVFDGDPAPLLTLSEGRLSLTGDATRFHLRQLAAILPQGRVEIEAELGTIAPYPLRASGRLEGEEFSAELDGEGSLAEPLLRLRAQGRDMQGQVTLVATPFEPLPLKTLELDIDKVNPATFMPDLPRADLRLRANLVTDAANGKPALHGPIHIGNSQPTPLEIGRAHV
jgi:translocation and assembly module TamB